MCDGELNETVSTELSHHLDECDECRTEYKRLIRLKNLFTQLGKLKAKAPQTFAQRFSEYRRENKLNNWQEVALNHFINRLLPIAALGLVIILGIFFAFPEISGPKHQCVSPDCAVMKGVIPSSEMILVSHEEMNDDDIMLFTVDGARKFQNVEFKDGEN